MFAGALLLALAAQAGAEGVPTADAGAVVGAFQDLCLRSDSFDDARQKVEAAGFIKGEAISDLGGAPLETYARAPLNIGLRQRKAGAFSCLVLFAHDPAAGDGAVVAAVTALPGFVPLSSKAGGETLRATWLPPRAPKGSKVFLSISPMGEYRSGVLTLEAKGKK
jgi:hypothetical protein